MTDAHAVRMTARLFTCALLFVFAFAGPAAADPQATPAPKLPNPHPAASPGAKPAAVTLCEAVENMRVAMAAARSYRSVLTVSGQGPGLTTMTEFVAPDRFHEISSQPGEAASYSESITIGSDNWTNTRHLGWKKTPPASSMRARGVSIPSGALPPGGMPPGGMPPGGMPPGGMPAANAGPPGPCPSGTDLGMDNGAHVYEANTGYSKIQVSLRPDFLPVKMVESGGPVTMTTLYSDWNVPITIDPPM